MEKSFLSWPMLHQLHMECLKYVFMGKKNIFEHLPLALHCLIVLREPRCEKEFKLQTMFNCFYELANTGIVYTNLSHVWPLEGLPTTSRFNLPAPVRQPPNQGRTGTDHKKIISPKL